MRLDIDTYKEILDTLTRNKMRSFLTGFGIFWGVFMLVFLIGGGGGTKEMLMNNFEGFATNSGMVFAQQTTKPYAGFRKGRQWQMNYTDVERLKAQVPELADVTLDCSQKGWGVTPVVGLDWKASEYLNLGVKFEAPTKMVYKNTSTLSPAAQAASELAKFRDGYKVREDIPAILSLGAMATPFEGLRLMTGWNVYFDSGVRKGLTADDGTELSFYKAGEYRPSETDPEHLMIRDIDANTWELNIGVEYDLNKYVTLSGSWQRTVYGISDTGISDLSFNNTNNMFAFGVRVKPIQHLSFDLGFMHTIYHDRSVTTPTAAGYKNDLFIRKNDVLGVGINYEF